MALPSRSMLVSVGLAALAIVLASVIWLELRADFRNSAPMMLSPAASLTVVPAGHATGPNPDQVARWTATSLARPLFAPGRRPPTQATAAAKPGTLAPDLPRIAGTMVTPAGRRAIFAAKGDKPLVVGEGAQVGAFTVQSIKAGQVTLLGPEGVRVLSPTFDLEAPVPPTPVQVPQALQVPPPPGATPAGIAVPGLPGFQLPPGLANGQGQGQVPFLPPRPGTGLGGAGLGSDPRMTR